MEEMTKEEIDEIMGESLMSMYKKGMGDAVGLIVDLINRQEKQGVPSDYLVKSIKKALKYIEDNEIGG